MKLTLSMLVLGVFCLALSSCEPPAGEAAEEVDMEALKAEIQAMEDKYAEGENTKNVDLIMEYYAEDAQSLPNEEPTTKGKDAIRARISKQMAKDTTDGGSVSFQVEEIFVEGDMLVEIGSSTSTTADGEVRKGKYMSLMEKRDGNWVCIRDIWNPDDDYDDDGDNDGEDSDSMEE